MHCLLIEDDETMADRISARLASVGHRVVVCRSAATARMQLAAERWDAVILDRGLPDAADGLELLASMRASATHTPVLVLSALGTIGDRVDGLRCGADDYLTKPFSFDELLARLEALQRRSVLAGDPEDLRIGQLHIDLRHHRVSRDGAAVRLQPKEYLLLEYLARQRGRLVTREALLDAVWGYRFDPGTKVLDVQISRLRQKIGDDPQRPLIRTIRGSGYCLDAPEHGHD